MVEEHAESPDQLAEAVRAIVTMWRVDNPRARTLPRSLRRQVNLAVREDNRRQLLDYDRARLRIETAVRDHQHNMLVGYRPRGNETMDTWFVRQQQLGRERLAVERMINAETRLSDEDRGQAVTALSVAHHAPSVPMLPVFTPRPPTGLHALRARVEAGISRLKVGLMSGKDRSRIERWAQLHRERAEQAQRLPNRSVSVDTAHAVGLGDHGVWVSRDTYDQREAKVAEREAAATVRETRVAELEETLEEMWGDNRALSYLINDLTGQLRRLGQEPAKTDLAPSSHETAQKLQSALFALYGAENRPEVEQTPGGPQWAQAFPEGDDPALRAAIAEAENRFTAYLSEHRRELGDHPEWRNHLDWAPADAVGIGEPGEATAADLIGTAHPDLNAPTATRPADATAGTGGQFATATRTASDDLGV